MKKSAWIIAILLLFATTVSAQENNQNLKEYQLPPFTGIDAGSLSNVYITMGTIQSIKIEKDDEDELNTRFNVRNGILIIRNSLDASDNQMNNEKIYISCINLEYLKASGVSKIKSQNLIKSESLNIIVSGASKIDLNIEVNDLTSDISGASKLTLKGNALHHTANLSGASKMNANELLVLSMNIEGSGVAKANINVKNKLTGEMTGVSSINFTNKPDTFLLSTVNINNDNFGNNKNPQIIKKKNRYEDTDLTNDTINDIENEDIEIIKTKKRRFIFGMDENGDFIFEKKDRDKPYTHRFKGHWAGFELAFNGFVNNDFGTALPAQYEFLELNDAKSIGVNLNFFELNGNIINNRLGVVSGIGLQWNNYRFSDNVVLLPDSGSIYGIHNTAISTYSKSKLVESWVRAPVFLEYQTAKKHWKQFHLAVGGVFGYKIGSHSKQVHFEGGDRNKDKIYNDFYLNPIKLDAEVRIGWGPINLFASYAITPMFKENKGPEVYPYMIGVTLTGW